MNSLAFLCLLWLACPSVSNPAPLQSVQPLWAREVLRQEFNGFKNPLKVMTIPQDRPGVVFLDNNRLIVYETDSTGELSSRANPDVRSSYELYASVIDSGSGELLFTKNWGTRAYGASIHVTAGGILIQTTDELRILADNFAEIRNVPFPHAEDPTFCNKRMISVSPTGQTLMLNCFINTGERNFSHLELLNGKTFGPEYTWTEFPALYERTYSISDKGIVTGLRVKQFGRNVWHSFIEARQTVNLNTSDVRSALTFITNTSLICLCYGGVSLVSTAGRVLATQPIPENIIIGNQHNSASQVSSVANKVVAVARDGQFIAVSFDRWEIRSHLLTEASSRRISTQILVCDSLLRHCPLTVDVTPIPAWNGDYDFALSPDGSKLAVLNGPNISVYSVPIN